MIDSNDAFSNSNYTNLNADKENGRNMMREMFDPAEALSLDKQPMKYELNASSFNQYLITSLWASIRTCFVFYSTHSNMILITINCIFLVIRYYGKYIKEK